jgi:uncharacterized protein
VPSLRNRGPRSNRRPDRRVVAKYLCGCVSFSVGAYLFITSHLGTDPLDTFALGLLRHLPLTVGFVQFGVATVCVTTVALWTRSRPLVSPLVTFLLCGSIIDLQLWIDWAQPIPASYGMLAVGTICCASGSALIIMSGLGIRAMDLVAIQALRAWSVPFWVGKGVLEMVLLAAGYLLGGPAGIGTVVFLVGVDVLIQPIMWISTHALRFANHGMPQPAPVPSSS